MEGRSAALEAGVPDQEYCVVVLVTPSKYDCQFIKYLSELMGRGFTNTTHLPPILSGVVVCAFVILYAPRNATSAINNANKMRRI